MQRLKNTLFCILAVVALIFAIGSASAISQGETITITKIALIITGFWMFGLFTEAL